MPSRISRADVEAVAALAHLELDEAEIELFVPQLDGILDYVDQLTRIDTRGVPPTSHVGITGGVERGDDVRPGLDRDEALAAAPDANRLAGLFRVPRVIG